MKKVGLHDWVKQKFQGNITEQPKNVPVVEKNQRTLQDTIQASSNIASYRRLFERKTYIRFWRSDRIAAEWFKVFTRKVAWKGMCWIHWCASWYIKEGHFIYFAWSVSLFLAFDGSQSRKTGTEKELYSKCANCIQHVLFMGKLWNFF